MHNNNCERRSAFYETVRLAVMAETGGGGASSINGRPEWLEAGQATTTEDHALVSAGGPSGARSLSGGTPGLLVWQHRAGVLSHILALAAVSIVSLWVSDEAMGGGGVSWEEGEAKLVFNWHPVLMVLAFSFMTVSSLAFSMPWKSSHRRINKALHVTEWVVAAICAAVGMAAVFKSHNDPSSGFIANLYSLHSWVGLGVISLYVCQFLVGIFSFGVNIRRLSPGSKATVMSIHKFLGSFIYKAVALTILLGIQEKEGFINCSYQVDEADVNPIQHFSDIPRVCKISHSLGLIIFAMAISTGFSLHDFVYRSPVVSPGRRDA